MLRRVRPSALPSPTMTAVITSQRLHCLSEPAALWTIVADTERLNRAIGLGKIKLTPNADGTAARFLVDTVSGGVPLRYEERPYEWREARAFSVRRVMRGGLLAEMTNSFKLERRADGGTILDVEIAIVPRVALLAPVLRIQLRRFVARVVRHFRHVDDALVRGRRGSLEQGAPTVQRERFDEAAEAFLSCVSAEVRPAAEQLLEYVATASDLDVDCMRPYALADLWRIERRLLIDACVEASRVGLVEPRVDVMCPSCRAAVRRSIPPVTASDTEHDSCQLCDIGVTATAERSHCVSFRVARDVREVDSGPYCIGGPARAPHVVAQAIVAAGGSVTLVAPDDPGGYGLWARGGKSGQLEVRVDAPASVYGVLSDDGFSPQRLAVAPGGTLRLEHTSAGDRHVKIERVDWADEHLTLRAASAIPGLSELLAGVQRTR